MATSPKRIETLVGFFLFVGLVLLGILIMQFGRFADRFQGVYTVTVSFSDASGLIKGSQVRLSGAKVGQVIEDPALTPEGKIEVEMVIRKDTPNIDRNSVFQISSLSILGDKAIMITPPGTPEEQAGEYIKDGDFIVGAEAGGLEALQTDAEQIASDAAVLISRGKTTLTKVDGALDDLRSVSAQLGESLDRINSGLVTDENMSKFTTALDNLENATGSIKEASLDIKPLLGDAQDAIRSFDQAAKAAEVTFSQASSEISKLGPTLQKVPHAVDSISQVADEAKGALKSVTDSEGLLGSLAYDRDMKGDAKTFMRNLRHYGILRYKDAETADERDPRNRFRGRRR
ncbi:MAG: MlaD family protein [Verrucomicrobiota bacterium]|nr:MlaD family protein [Verrucomicrobiota bacterium]